MQASVVWEKLLIEGKEIVTSKEVKELAEKIGKDGENTLYYLQEEDYLSRIFRGIFYVKSLEERKRSVEEYSIYELIAMALDKKGIENWYFALETALKLNNMTHEYFIVDYAFTGSYRTTKVIEIQDQKFKFFKRKKEHFSQGVMEDENIRYSDPEKTTLDLTYRSYLNDDWSDHLKQYEDKIETSKIKRYLKDYSKSFEREVLRKLKK